MKKIIILVLLIILWVLLVMTPRVKAEAPVQEQIVPQEVVGTPIKEFAYNQVKFRWDVDQWKSFNNIIERESRWDCTSQNPRTSAYGCGQFLNSTWNEIGYEKTSDPQIQIMATIEYISQRYSNPNEAWKFWQKNNYY